MREEASKVEMAAKTKPCPKCAGTTFLLSPMKEVPVENAVYHCKACGGTFWHNGNPFVDDIGSLRDVFRGASLGEIVKEKTSKTTPAQDALFTAKLMEYGLQMWFDGLKQGLLLGAANAEKQRREDGKV